MSSEFSKSDTTEFYLRFNLSLRLLNIMSEHGFAKKPLEFIQLSEMSLGEFRGFGAKCMSEVLEIRKILNLQIDSVQNPQQMSMQGMEKEKISSNMDSTEFNLRFNLSVRLYNIMSHAGYSEKPIEFVKLPDVDLIHFKGFGAKCAKEILEIRKVLNLPEDQTQNLEKVNLQEIAKSNISSDIDSFFKSFGNLNNHIIGIPKDIRNLETRHIYKFTRWMPIVMTDPLKRLVKRVSKLKELDGLSIKDFLGMSGIGKTTARSFIEWYSQLHLGSLDEFVDNKSPTKNYQIVGSAFLLKRLRRRGIKTIADLKKLDDDENNWVSSINYVELRTIKFTKSKKYESAANMHWYEGISHCIQKFIEEDLDDKTKEIYYLRYMTDMGSFASLQEIAIKSGLTRERVRQILERTNKVFVQRYIISTDHFLKQFIRKIYDTGKPISVSDVFWGKSNRQSKLTSFYLNIISDVFPYLPIDTMLPNSKSRWVQTINKNLKKKLKGKQEVAFDSIFRTTMLDSQEILHSLHSILASKHFSLINQDGILFIYPDSLTLDGALMQCLREYDRPVNIEEFVFYLDSCRNYKGKAHLIYRDRTKRKNIGSTSIFSRLNATEGIVRIEKYAWGLEKHLNYDKTHWDNIGSYAANLIEIRAAQVSTAHLFSKLKNVFPLLRSRYELDYILKRCSQIVDIGYQTYVIPTMADRTRRKLKDLVLEILVRYNHPITITHLIEEIKKIRTFREEGVFTLLNQQEGIELYFNQYVSLKSDSIDGIMYVINQPEFVTKQISRMYPDTSWSHFETLLCGLLSDYDEYIKFISKLESVRYYRGSEEIFLICKSSK
jgi:hypothetical protein